MTELLWTRTLLSYRNGKLDADRVEHGIRRLALADVDTSGERARVAVNSVVGYLQVVVPGVNVDAAAAL